MLIVRSTARIWRVSSSAESLIDGSSCMAWLASSWPLVTSVLSVSPRSAVLEPMRKKVARTPLAFKMELISDVYWEGPSSMVSARILVVVEMWNRTSG